MTNREVEGWAHVGLCGYCGSSLHDFVICPDPAVYYRPGRARLRRLSETKLDALKEDMRRDRDKDWP